MDTLSERFGSGSFGFFWGWCFFDSTLEPEPFFPGADVFSEHQFFFFWPPSFLYLVMIATRVGLVFPLSLLSQQGLS